MVFVYIYHESGRINDVYVMERKTIVAFFFLFLLLTSCGVWFYGRLVAMCGCVVLVRRCAIQTTKHI